MRYVRVNFMIPQNIYSALKSFVPDRKRSKLVASLLAQELKKREQALFKIAQAVEKDKALNAEMKDWDAVMEDGLMDSEWK